MSECISTSKIFGLKTALLASLIVLSMMAVAFNAQAQTQPQIPPGANGEMNPEQQPAIPPGTAPKKEETPMFEPHSPYLEYGDFNLGDDEDQETLFYQYGRFFGISVGAGYESATGNRGLLYEAAIPRVDIRVHYWFDFNFALNFGVFFANHTYNYLGSNYKVSLVGFGADLKYYFDVKNMGSALTFANPFILAGVAAITKTESQATNEPDTDSTLSFGVGGGLEFPIVYKSTYFVLEGRYFTQSFQDAQSSNRSARVPDLSGGFFTLLGHILFTW